MSFESAFQHVQHRRSQHTDASNETPVDISDSILSSLRYSVNTLPLQSIPSSGMIQSSMPVSSPIVGMSMRKKLLLSTPNSPSMSIYRSQEENEIGEQNRDDGNEEFRISQATSPFAMRMRSLRKGRDRRNVGEYYITHDETDDSKNRMDLSKISDEDNSSEDTFVHTRSRHAQESSSHLNKDDLDSIQKVLKEIESSERWNLLLMEECMFTFAYPLREVLDDATNSSIKLFLDKVERGFAEYGDLLGFNKRFGVELKHCIRSGDVLDWVEAVSKLFLRYTHTQGFLLNYADNFNALIIAITQCELRSQSFSIWKQQQENNVDRERMNLSLQEYLALPLQRMVQYESLLMKIAMHLQGKNTSTENQQFRVLKEAIHSLEPLAKHCSKKKHKSECIVDVIELAQNLQLPYRFIKPSRTLIKRGTVRLVDGNFANACQNVQILLLTDMLFLASLDNGTLIHQIDLKDPVMSILSMSTSLCTEEQDDMDSMQETPLLHKRLVIDLSHDKLILECKNQEERDQWISSLLGQIAERLDHAQYVQQQQLSHKSNSNSNIVLAGWLQVRKEMSKTFRYRYVVVSETKCEYYQEKDKIVKGSFSLLHGKLMLPNEDDNDSLFCVETPRAKCYFQAKSIHERDGWMIAFESVGVSEAAYFK